MPDFVTRTEHDDIVRHLTTKVDRAQQQALSACARADESAAVARLLRSELAHFFRVFSPLLPEVQASLLALEMRAGVVEGDALEVNSIEPNDGAEWRERLRQRAFGKQIPSISSASSALPTELL
jgi:urease accessory protein UreH